MGRWRGKPAGRGGGFGEQETGRRAARGPGAPSSAGRQHPRRVPGPCPARRRGRGPSSGRRTETPGGTRAGRGTRRAGRLGHWTGRQGQFCPPRGRGASPPLTCWPHLSPRPRPSPAGSTYSEAPPPSGGTCGPPLTFRPRLLLLPRLAVSGVFSEPQGWWGAPQPRGRPQWRLMERGVHTPPALGGSLAPPFSHVQAQPFTFPPSCVGSPTRFLDPAILFLTCRLPPACPARLDANRAPRALFLGGRAHTGRSCRGLQGRSPTVNTLAARPERNGSSHPHHSGAVL